MLLYVSHARLLAAALAASFCLSNGRWASTKRATVEYDSIACQHDGLAASLGAAHSRYDRLLGSSAPTCNGVVAASLTLPTCPRVRAATVPLEQVDQRWRAGSQ